LTGQFKTACRAAGIEKSYEPFFHFSKFRVKSKKRSAKIAKNA